MVVGRLDLGSRSQWNCGDGLLASREESKNRTNGCFGTPLDNTGGLLSPITRLTVEQCSRGPLKQGTESCKIQRNPTCTSYMVKSDSQAIQHNNDQSGISKTIMKSWRSSDARSGTVGMFFYGLSSKLGVIKARKCLLGSLKTSYFLEWFSDYFNKHPYNLNPLHQRGGLLGLRMSYRQGGCLILLSNNMEYS